VLSISDVGVRADSIDHEQRRVNLAARSTGKSHTDEMRSTALPKAQNASCVNSYLSCVRLSLSERKPHTRKV